MTKVDDLLTYAQAELGKPYVYGDEGPGAFDCSGLMQWIYGKIGVSLPRTAAEQQKFASPVSQPQPGDLVFWGTPAYHVALYVGNGKIIAAPQPGAKVQVQDVWGTPAGYGRIQGVGSILTPALGVATSAVSWTSDTVSSLLGGAKDIAYTSAFVALGLALLGLGAWYVVQPQVAKIGKQLL